MAWGNSAGGFIDNGNPGTLVFERDTAWRNGRAGFDVSRSTSRLSRNLAVGNAPARTDGSATAPQGRTLPGLPGRGGAPDRGLSGPGGCGRCRRRSSPWSRPS